MRLHICLTLLVIAAARLAVPALAQQSCDSVSIANDSCDGQCHLTEEQVPIKKLVYTTKCIPVCEIQPDCQAACGHTCKLFYKRVLIKKEVIVGYKCVRKCSLQ